MDPANCSVFFLLLNPVGIMNVDDESGKRKVWTKV